MKILLYGINYSPELTGIGKYSGEMGSWLAKNGHTVDVITAMPYYPNWQIQDGYKHKWWHVEYIDKVKVYRCPLYVPKKVTALKRIIHEFSFVLSTLPVWLKIFFQKKYDVVISVSPPFHLGILPFMYGQIRSGKIITHVHDLQIDMAKELGMIKSSAFLNMMFSLEKFILRKSALVSAVGKGLIQKVRKKGIDSSKCLLFPNWVDETAIRPMTQEESLRKEFGLSPHDKVILYSGNLGEKQGLENIIEAAKNFRDQEDVKFVIVGNGGCESKLKVLAQQAELKNIIFHPLLPYQQLPALLAMADLHLVLQKKDAADLVMPSKLTGILAAGGCPLVTAQPGSTLYNLIYKNRIGIVVEPDDYFALIKGIKNALNTNLEDFRRNARYYAKKFLAKEVILKRWEIKLLKLSGQLPASKKETALIIETPESKKITA